MNYDRARIVCWFSCGAASAVATKIAIEENRRTHKVPIVVARCYVEEEHPDNNRFADDCAAWFGEPVLVLKNEKFEGSIYKVFEKERYIAGINGAACTRALKKRVREDFENREDLQVFGYTAEEDGRADALIDANATIRLWTPLIERGLSHADCMAMIQRAGIALPVMYSMGYHHNNCIGCVKGGAGYWNKIRVDFPEAFNRQASLGRKLGVRLVKHNGARVFLDELPASAGYYPSEPEIQCGIFCEMTEKEYSA